MRARNIKPSFFINCDLAELDYATRLLFIGLWCYADREGRFEWKPKRIKAAIFPYDKVDIDKLLCNLMSLHFITSNDMIGYIPNFDKHQRPHPHEAKSTLPENPNEINVIACHTNGERCPSDIRNDDTMNTVAVTDSFPNRTEVFEKCWGEYPNKIGKESAAKHFKSQIKTIEQARLLFDSIQNYALKVATTDKQYIKHGSAFFNGLWKDYANAE